MKRFLYMAPLIVFCCRLPLTANSSRSLIPPSPDMELVRTIHPGEAGTFHVGTKGSAGVETDHKKHKPGYILHNLNTPMLLKPGLYRASFKLRRGHYPKKGFLHKTYGLYRLEIFDLTAKETIDVREIQLGDFNKPNQYETRWIDFSMQGRENHVLEPRIYWIGLANGEAAEIQIFRFADCSPNELAAKENRLSEHLRKYHLENGYVVSRKMDGTADETGDAITYTGFYITSLAWKFKVTKDPLVYQALENGLYTLHKSIKGSAEAPYLVRYIDTNGQPFEKGPSKDVYTAYFLAVGAAAPLIQNAALKKQIEADVQILAKRFLQDGLVIKSGDKSMVNLTPYFTEEEVESGIEKLLSDKKDLRKITKALKTAKRIAPFGEFWPGMVDLIRALEKKDRARLMALIPPTLDGAIKMVERARDILREQYRKDLFPKRYTNLEYPGIKLANTLTYVLQKFPKKSDGRRIGKLSDMKILASNALISLHIVKTAWAVTRHPAFEDYYQNNLYSQDELLKTALDWYGMEDDLVRLGAGNNAADSERRGYLGLLSLMNLESLETNPAVKNSYRTLIAREWDQYRHDNNPLAAAVFGTNTSDFITRDLCLYPEQRTGFGAYYWHDNGEEVANLYGGGSNNGFSREALPISHRPKDSFLWQRNARRLKGDEVKDYPATDYLFVYWFARAHNLIEPPSAASTVQK